MIFTQQEFDIMTDELLRCEPRKFDMLCHIAEKTLKSSVARWCRTEDCLRGRGYETDIMQEIQLRLIKTTVSRFLLRNGPGGPVNNDPEGFEDWLFVVARNQKRDFANKVRSVDFNTTGLDGSEAEEYTEEMYDSDAAERMDRLSMAFSAVLDADVSVYKTLTWIAQFVFILNNDITKIKSNELIVTTFENKTLFEMYDMILTASQRIPFITITEKQHEKIMSALRKTPDGGVSYGETRYKEFFMKSNGKVSGKKSISDWVNRLNGMINKKTKSVPDHGGDNPKKTNKKS